MNHPASRAPDGSIHLILPDGEYVLEQNADTYGEIGDGNRFINQYSSEPSPSRLRELSKARVACCCCHIKVCASMVVLFSLLGFALKYVLNSTDVESELTLKLLNIGDWYYLPNARVAIGVFQFVALIGLSLSIGTDCRYFAIPFIILQTILSLAQTAVVVIYLVLTAVGRLGSFEHSAHALIKLFLSGEIGQRIIASGDVVVGFVVVGVSLLFLFLNLYFWETAEQLFRYLRLKAIYDRLYD